MEKNLYKESKISFFDFYFSTKGSICVKDFLLKGFLPLYSILVFLLLFSDNVTYSKIFENFIFICILLNIYCLIAISIKRLRDMSKSYIWAIVIVIASLKIILPILYLVLLIPANKYKMIKIGFIFLYFISIPLLIILIFDISYILFVK